MARLAFSIPEACKVAATGRTALYGAIKAGHLRAVKNGRRTLILADDLRRWLSALPEACPGNTAPPIEPAQDRRDSRRR